MSVQVSGWMGSGILFPLGLVAQHSWLGRKGNTATPSVGQQRTGGTIGFVESQNLPHLYVKFMYKICISFQYFESFCATRF